MPEIDLQSRNGSPAEIVLRGATGKRDVGASRLRLVRGQGRRVSRQRRNIRTSATVVGIRQSRKPGGSEGLFELTESRLQPVSDKVCSHLLPIHTGKSQQEADVGEVLKGASRIIF